MSKQGEMILMIYTGFLISALITVIAAVKLSTYADVIGERTRLGGMLAGTLLLAGATSLPEVTTSLTAVVVENPDIAVSNVLGSNLFNLMILASFDVFYRRNRMFRHVGSDHQLTAWIGLFMTAVIALGMMSPMSIEWFNIGIEMFLMMVIYVAGIITLSKKEFTEPLMQQSTSIESVYHKKAISLKEAKVGFLIASVITLIAGSFLTLTGDAIAIATNMSSSFMGTFLIAAATSLPEVVAVLVAVQLANYALAVGNILGSNMFNLLILALVDFFVRDQAVLQAVHPVTILTVITVFLLNSIVLFALYKAKALSVDGKCYSLPSAVLVLLYFISSYFIFTLS
ncbi:sodium:calcium antiporter [Salisediminibacterium beveridgei]|uniref:Cation antiporter (Na+/Ca2+) n=1 Tax=Salisediminibacterium beveridgei TaxID=632773 RepID=A0A1D7QWK3_9BACI|nr:sodium:calcium antiporter [Salisediminibacterium beveridgei]AOM83382.1 cation antiporter (Na+/Ca2+) [Salisediminibacterium beveridgei]